MRDYERDVEVKLNIEEIRLVCSGLKVVLKLVEDLAPFKGLRSVLSYLETYTKTTENKGE